MGVLFHFYWKYRWTLLPTTPPIVLLHQLQCHRLGDHQSSTFRVFNPVRLLMAEPVVKMSPFHFLQLDFRLASTLTLIAVSLSTLLQSCRSIVMKLIHLQTSSTPPPQGRWWSTSPPLCIQQSGLNTLSFIHLWAASTPYCHETMSTMWMTVLEELDHTTMSGKIDVFGFFLWSCSCAPRSTLMLHSWADVFRAPSANHEILVSQAAAHMTIS